MAGTHCGRMVSIHFVTASFLMETGSGEQVIKKKKIKIHHFFL